MFPFPRRRRSDDPEAPGRTPTHRAGGTTTDTPPRPGLRRPGTPEEKRFSQVYAEDRVGPMPYPNQASPDVAAARGRVRSLVNDLLPNAVDEGTGAALDPLIASWASGWLARIDSEHADHHAVIDRLVGGARQQLADAEANHERDRRALEIARRDYADARDRLMETPRSPAVRPGVAEDDETVADDPRRSASRGPRAARQALTVRRPDIPDDEPLTSPLRVRTGPAVEDAATEQETR
ncbi:hypothetical protein [Actinomycetospora termitidis]|uniref:PE-PGRS family protein n=1 Tax=Actinomycetospora termitidis TaxID=3053470 RepID=A0ABT7M4T5_9PSEU|nr:hypothetical protein [Actinomycetospora sp. Odt1-22]MDL5155685.1 hypothetical protein [Actinomycetospora sp. Odt1-22]